MASPHCILRLENGCPDRLEFLERIAIIVLPSGAQADYRVPRTLLAERSRRLKRLPDSPATAADSATALKEENWQCWGAVYMEISESSEIPGGFLVKGRVKDLSEPAAETKSGQDRVARAAASDTPRHATREKAGESGDFCMESSESRGGGWSTL